MGVKTETLKRRKYDSAFKEEVLNMVYNGRLVSDVAQSLGIGENLIYKWKSRAAGKAKPVVVATEVNLAQVEALHKNIRALETERDILKSVYSAGAVEWPLQPFRNNP